MKYLNFLPLPLVGESPTSLIKRLAKHNGYSNCEKFIAFHLKQGNQKTSPLMQGGRFQKLITSQVGPALEQPMRNGFYQPADPLSPSGSFYIGTIKINRRLLRPVRAALCTECVKEGWERTVKDICITFNCPIHNRQYLFACPHCQRLLTWRNQTSLLCSCGRELESPRIKWGQAYAERTLLRILEQGNQQDFDSLLRILFHLGLKLIKINATCDHAIFTAATALFNKDLHHAAKSLSRLTNVSDELEIEILRAKLKTIIPIETLNSLINLLDTLPPKITLGAREQTVPTRFMLPLLRISLRQWQILSASPNAQSIFSSHTKGDVYSKNEVLQLKQLIREQGQSIFVPNVTNTAAFKQVYCTRFEAASIIGISVNNIDFLAKQGLLGNIHRKGHCLYLHRSAVNEIQKYYLPLREVCEQAQEDAEAVRLAIRTANPKISFLRSPRSNPMLILKKDISRVYDQLLLLPRLTYAVTEKSKRMRYVTANEKLIHITKASEYLGVFPTTLRFYRNLGVIGCDPKNLVMVSKKDVKIFNSRYVTSSSLAKELEIPRTKVSHLLEPRGIYPLSGRTVNGNPNVLWPRSRIPANLKNLLNPTGSTFGAYHLNGGLISFAVAAEKTGLSKADFIKIFNKRIKHTRPDYYRCRLEVTPDEVNQISSFISSLSPLSELLAARNLSHGLFTRRFVSPGYVSIITTGGADYLTSADMHKIVSLLDKYCNAADAGKILHIQKNTVSQLFIQGRLTPIFLPGYAYSFPLIEIDEVYRLSILRTQELSQ